MQGIFATIDDLVSIFNCSYTTAHRKYNVIKDALEKEKHQQITVHEMCDYLGISEDDYNSAIKRSIK